MFCGNVLISRCKRLTDLGALWHFITDWMSSFSLTFCQYIISSQKKGKHRKHKGLKVSNCQKLNMLPWRRVSLLPYVPWSLVQSLSWFTLYFPTFFYKFTSLHSFKAKLVMKIQIWAWSKYCKFCIPKGLCKCLLTTPLRRHFVNIGWYSTSLKQFLNLKWTSAYSSKPSQLTRFNY